MDGVVSRMVAEGTRTEEQVGAAMLRCLRKRRTVTWAQFVALVADAASRQPAAAAPAE